MTDTNKANNKASAQLRTVVWVLGIIATIAPVAVAWGMLILNDKVQTNAIEKKLDKDYFLLYKENVDAKLNKIEGKIDDIHNVLIGDPK